jgi:putative peptidoglycan lipid II flippase
MTEDRQVTRNAAIFSSATALSRILGLVRTALIAGGFGTSLAASAFFFAYSIPNMLRRLSGEGALGGAFIPVFTEEIEKRGSVAGFRLANTFGLLISLVLIGLMLLMTIVLQSIGLVFGASQKTILVVKLTQLMLPYLFFISLAGFGMAVLNSLNHFFVPAISPAIHNVILIGSLFLLCPLMGDTKEKAIYGLAMGVLIGGAVQLAILYFPLKGKRYSLKTGVDLHAEGVKKVSRLFLPGMFSLAVTQINAVVDKLLAFFVKGHETSAPSELFYGNLIVELPLAVFGVSLGVAVFPSLSRLRASGRMQEFKSTFGSALRQSLAIALPASVGLVLLREPIIALVYQRRAFGHAAAEAVAPVLMCYGVGLFAYTAIKIIVPAFLSLQDPRTPMKVGLGMTLLNFGLNCVAVFVMRRVWGLALSTSFCAVTQTALLLYILREKIGLLGGRRIARSAVRIALATLGMGVIVAFALLAARGVAPGAGALARIIQLALPVGCGLISYPVFCHLLHVSEVREVLAAFARTEKT